MSRKFKCIFAVILIIVAVFSATFIADKMSAPESYDQTMVRLNEMQDRALGMTASATALSTGAAAVPGDATTPIANKLMDISGYMIIVYVAIVLEKYLLTLTGLISFKVLIPVGCVLFAMGMIFKSENRKAYINQLAAKVVLIALLLWALVPTSVIVSDTLTNTYDDMTVIAEVQQEIQVDDSVENGTDISEEGKTGFNIKSIISSAKTKAKDIADDVSKGIEVKTEELENSFSQMIEGVAIMIVTTCVIPICVLMIFIWILKTVTGAAFPMPTINSVPKLSKKFGKKTNSTDII